MAKLKLNQSELIQLWKEEEQQPFSGWDFSYLDGRMIEDRPPWSYLSLVAQIMRDSAAVLDMGTGGGERFLRLKDYWPEKVVATEEYPPNVKLAGERLSPFGVQVLDVRLTNHDPMPLEDGEFDLIINRHSPFNSDEVARMLTPDGVFLTQQVHGLWAQDLLFAFDTKPQWPYATLAYSSERLRASGLTIEIGQEWQGKLTFIDVGAVVYYIKAVPWMVPGFSVDTHWEYLLRLQEKLDEGCELAFKARKYLIRARKGLIS